MPLVSRIRHVTAVLLTAIATDVLSIDGQARPQTETPLRPPYLPPGPRDEPFQLPPLEILPATELPTGGDETLLRQVLFQGNTVISTRELEQVAAPYIGKRLADAELEELRRKLTQYYIARGYVNSGALLAKDIPVNQGMIAFRIVEGRVSRVQIRGLERLREEYVTGRLVPWPEEPLNLNTLRERYQLLLDDPLFARINTRVMPDADAWNAILDVEVVRAQPYQLTVFANDYRPPSIGANAFGLSGNLRNLTGFGDLLDFYYQEPMQGNAGSRYQIGWRVPVNQLGTAISLRLDHGRSVVVEAPLNPLNITDQFNSRDFGISHPVFESLRHKFSLGINSVDQTIDSTLLGEGFSFTPGVPDGMTKAHVWRLWQEYSYRTETKAMVVRSTFSRETNNNEDPGVTPVNQPPGRYRYWFGQFQYAQRIGDAGTQAVLRGTIQRAETRVLPVDAISIGGVYSVRGYRENLLIRDNGQILGFQVDFPVSSGARDQPQIVAGPFFDWGRGSNFGDTADIISSLGVALKAAWRGFRFDLAVAKRLIHPSAIDSVHRSLQDKGVHLQIAYDVF